MYKLSVFFLLILSSIVVSAQNKAMLPYAIQTGTLDQQFINITNMSRSQDSDFKLIRKTNLEIIRNNVKDSIKRYTKEIADLKSSSSSSTTTISSLKDSLSTVKAELSFEKTKTESISFLGMDFIKSTYHMMVWTIIIVLALAFIITFASFRKAKIDTTEHKNNSEEFQAELLAFKKKALETEQKLKRQLLDEQLKRNS